MKSKMDKIHITSRITVDHIERLALATDFTTHHGPYRSIFTRKDTLQRILGRKGRIALALLDNKIIVGYAALDYPNAQERWSGLGDQSVMEMRAVEVSRGFRNQGIARQLLTRLLRDPRLNQKIIYLIAYSWTWDLAYSGLSTASYRQMLMTFYADFGFLEYSTNEPNICLKPENIFMARVGKGVLQTIQERFKWLRFGLPV